MRRTTVDVRIGDLMMGSNYPIRIQSMTTTDTMDTQATVAQSIRMIEAGCELVRITAPSQREALNLEAIRSQLRARGYTTPLVADIHYTPNAAEIAARIVEKVRINPGNYIDKKKFEVVEYDDAAYNAELERVRERFLPLLRICAEYGTALRIGTNHGSLSDRIVNRYGDNPAGMVESALEFLRIAADERFHNIVLSMKSSNPIVMIEAYRLLVQQLEAEGLPPYPLHLGVTEAGDGDDGRVKSAVGIGTLLEDGLGDTIRVSLTEEPEAELPVARALAARYDPHGPRGGGRTSTTTSDQPITIHYARHRSTAVSVVGGEHVPRVIADLRGIPITEPSNLAGIGHLYDPLTDKWTMTDQAAEFILVGDQPLPFMPPSGIRQLVDSRVWTSGSEKLYRVPVWTAEDLLSTAQEDRHPVLNVIHTTISEITPTWIARVQHCSSTILLVEADGDLPYRAFRDMFRMMRTAECTLPVIVASSYAGCHDHRSLEQSLLQACTDVGSILADGFGDGVLLRCTDPTVDPYQRLSWSTTLSFGILQATRLRMTKTEYISCPSCGRTLFDLQETTARIRSHTDHLKGVKIGIMGCIVNGPGEMADADYGYVGSGPGKITLYRGQTIVQRAVPTSDAVDALINVIREDGRWIERGE